MNEESWRGNLATTPFPLVLFRIWERKKSGHLRIKGQEGERALYFSGGDLALAEGFFSEDNFLKKIIAARLLSVLQGEECARLARENKISLPRALVECGHLPPTRVWKSLTDFWIDDLLPLFDRSQADYAFEPSSNLEEAQIFTATSTLEFILQGIRQMKNFSLIEAFLPPDAGSLQVLSPAYADNLKLSTHEKYVLNIIQHSPRLQDLYALSQLGKKETQRVLFTFLHLGLAGLSQQRNKIKPAAELSSAGLEKIWSDFNDKCSYIFKYTSKEIGPVALNVLEKALDEVRAKLGPPLQGLELRPDGRVEFKPFPLMSLNLYAEDSLKNFIRVLNEILVAEVLAVKKTLGNVHEAAIVKNLERIGEPA
jgi:hypothetical protein